MLATCAEIESLAGTRCLGGFDSSFEVTLTFGTHHCPEVLDADPRPKFTEILHAGRLRLRNPWCGVAGDGAAATIVKSDFRTTHRSVLLKGGR
jgi:hypothetical protein